MAYGSNNRGKGFASLRWKKTNFGTEATMWFRPTKKDGVFKYTLSFGKKTVTMLVDVNSMKLVTSKSGQTMETIPVKCLLGSGTGYTNDSELAIF